jgi:hypothetical protein
MNSKQKQHHILALTLDIYLSFARSRSHFLTAFSFSFLRFSSFFFFASSSCDYK